MPSPKYERQILGRTRYAIVVPTRRKWKAFESVEFKVGIDQAIRNWIAECGYGLHALSFGENYIYINITLPVDMFYYDFLKKLRVVVLHAAREITQDNPNIPFTIGANRQVLTLDYLVSTCGSGIQQRDIDRFMARMPNFELKQSKR